MEDTQILALFEIVTKALERNTEVMDKVATAVQNDADASFKMAVEVKGLRKTVSLAQQKVGGELGAVIDESKRTIGKLNAEREEVRSVLAGSQAAKRGGPNAGA